MLYRSSNIITMHFTIWKTQPTYNVIALCRTEAYVDIYVQFLLLLIETHNRIFEIS